MRNQNLKDKYNPDRIKGTLEIVFKDKDGKELGRYVDHNIIKIFMKDHISHTIPYHSVWDPNGGSGDGDWVQDIVNHEDLYYPKYIILGAAFDTDPSNYGAPLSTNDPNFYQTDPVTGQKIPIIIYSGANFDGGLIKAIPIMVSDNRPLKRIEEVSFPNATYQPAGTPYLREDVRAINNVVRYKTTLQTFEYNGFGTAFNYFDICEVALVSGPAFGSEVSDCDCDPHELFMLGEGGTYWNGGTSIEEMEVSFTTNTDILTLTNPANASFIHPGDQIKLNVGSIDQITPHYLVMAVSGNQIFLDRVPKDSDNNNITSGTYSILVDRFRILAHRILEQPFSKSASLEIDILWTFFYQ